MGGLDHAHAADRNKQHRGCSSNSITADVLDTRLKVVFCLEEAKQLCDEFL